MKYMLVLTFLLLSAKSMAHTCHISLYDPYNRPFLNFYSYMDNNCVLAANKCYQAIVEHRLNPNQYKCYTVSMTNDDGNQPTRPGRPLPGTITPEDQEYRREIERGERVIFQNNLYVVIYANADGIYEIMPDGGEKRDIVKNIPRNQLAITRGCLRNICTKTSVLLKRIQRNVSVEGIDFSGKYILREVGGKDFISNVDFLEIQ